MSLANPQIKITNLSTVVNAANLKWVFEVISPSGTPIHIGDFIAPDINSVPFAIYTVPEQIPMVFGQLEFSAINSYSVKVYVQDSTTNIYSEIKKGRICKPNGNNGKNNFGYADVSVEAKCSSGKLLITDKTNVLYNSLTGTKVSTSVKLSYPKDDDGNQPADFLSNQLPLLANILNGGDGYGLYAAHIYDYEVNPGFFVRIRYTYNNKSFPVWCNVDLCPLFCEYDKLLEIVSKNCDSDAKQENNKKLLLINAKIQKAVIGILQPLCGFDVPKIIEEIKEIGGFTCDCCRPQGISGIGSVIGSDFTLAVNKIGGDMELNWTSDGNGNYTLNYSDYSYVFNICEDSNSTAFQLIPSTSGYVKRTCLKVSMLTLATEVLTEIQNNPSLISIINSIVTQTALSCSINSQGLFNTTCNFVTQVNAAVALNTIYSITINGVINLAPDNLLVTQDVAIATWLNSLSLGTFSVNYNSTTKLTTVISTVNTNAVSTIKTLTSGAAEGVGPNYIFSSTCGNICSILQSIIDYLKNLNLLQIKIGDKVNVCSINADGSVTTTEFLGQESAYQLAVALGSASCNASSYLASKGLSPNNLKSQFSEYTSTSVTPVAGDYFFMVVNGALVKMPIEKASIGIFKLLSSDSAVKDVYCQGSLCTNVNACSPVTNLAIAAGDTSAFASWTSVVGAVGYKYSLDGVNYSQIVSTSLTIPGLTANTTYSLRIYPVYNNGNGLPCLITQSFDTTDAGVLCIAPISFSADNITDNNARLTWLAVTGATGYQYRVNGGSWINTGNVLAVVVSGLVASTSYTANIRAIIGGTACSQISSTAFNTTNSVVILANNFTGAATDFVATRFTIDGLNVYGGAAIANGGTANITVPLITTGHTYGVRVITNIAATNTNVRLHHNRGASTLHNKPFVANGSGATTDIIFDLSFVAQAGDVFALVIEP